MPSINSLVSSSYGIHVLVSPSSPNHLATTSFFDDEGADADADNDDDADTTDEDNDGDVACWTPLRSSPDSLPFFFFFFEVAAAAEAAVVETAAVDNDLVAPVLL